MKIKLISLTLCFILLLTFKSFAKYEDYSCFSQDTQGHYTRVDEYKKKIEESKIFFNTLIETQNYDILISELNIIYYCYERLNQQKKYIENINDLIEANIISKKKFSNKKFKIKIEDINALIFKYQMGSKYQRLNKNIALEDWKYHLKLLQIFSDMPEPYLKEIYQFFWWSNMTEDTYLIKGQNEIFIKEYSEYLINLISYLKQKENYEYYIKFSKEYLRFTKFLDPEKCVKFTHELYLNEILTKKIPYSALMEFKNSFGHALECSSYNISNFDTMLSDYPPFLEKLQKIITDLNNPDINLSNSFNTKEQIILEYENIYLRLVSVLEGLSDVKGDLTASDFYRNRYFEKNIEFNTNRKFIFYQNNIFYVKYLIREKNYKKAEDKINNSLVELENMTIEDYFTDTLKFSKETEEDQRVANNELNSLKNAYFNIYADILLLTGRHSEYINTKKKIILFYENYIENPKNTGWDLTLDTLYRTREIQYLLPAAYTDLIKQFITLYDYKQAKKYLKKIKDLCTRLREETPYCLFLNEHELNILIGSKGDVKEGEKLIKKVENEFEKFSKFFSGNQKIKYEYNMLFLKQGFYNYANEIEPENEGYLKELCTSWSKMSDLVNKNQEMYNSGQRAGVFMGEWGCLLKSKKYKNTAEQEKKNSLRFIDLANDWLIDYEKTITSSIGYNYFHQSNTNSTHATIILSTSDNLLKLNEHKIDPIVKKGMKKLINNAFRIMQYESGLYKIKAQKRVINKTKDQYLINLLDKRDKYENKLNLVVTSLLSAGTENNNIDLKINLENQIKKIDQEIKKKYKNFTKANKINVYEISEIQKKLAENEAVLYFKNEPSLLISVITQNEVNFYADWNLKAGKMNSDINKGLLKIKETNNNDYMVYLLFLYHKVFANIEKYITGKNNLYVITDKIYSPVPFEALLLNDYYSTTEAYINRTKEEWDEFFETIEPEYLNSKYSFTYFPSISAFVELYNTEKKNITRESAFLGIGNPDFDDENTNLDTTKKIAKFNRILLNNRGYLSNSKIISERYNEIPFTENELKAISPLFNTSKLFLQKDADESNIKKMDLKKYDIISFATHAEIFDSLDGFNEPFLVLTPPKVTSEVNDGLLTSSEISELNLNAKIVILSACNTASKEDEYAVGFSGLINSFFMAGTDAVIATHWPVEDKAGYLLVSETIKKIINQKLPKSEALRETKLEFIAGKFGEEYKHPFYWAPYVLIGN